MASLLYPKPSKSEPVLFGDLFVADFLFDAWLEEDATLLGALRVRGGHTAYGAHAAPSADPHLLAHGRVPVAVMLVNDDCYATRVFERKHDTRLQFVPVFALDQDEQERQRQLSSSDYTRFPLPPEPPIFEGGVAHLNYPFGFDVVDAAARTRLRAKRIAQLSKKLALALEHRAGAHNVRRGMLVASTTRRKLEALLDDAAGSKIAAKNLSKLLSITWALEGGIADQVDIAVERSDNPEDLIAQLVAWTDDIADAAAAARDALAAVAVARS